MSLYLAASPGLMRNITEYLPRWCNLSGSVGMRVMIMGLVLVLQQYRRSNSINPVVTFLPEEALVTTLLVEICVDKSIGHKVTYS